MLDDPTFNILNSLLFFNQIDIIAHIGNNDSFLRSLFEGFKEQKLDKKLPPNMPLKNIPTSALNPRTRDIVAFLHQLMLMGKQVQAQHRLALYKILLERGLLYVCELALQRPETAVINQGAEMISLILDHDLNGIRSHCMREHEAKRRTVADDICALLVESKDLGLKSQMSDAIRALVDVGLDPTDVSHTRVEGLLSRAINTDSFVWSSAPNFAGAERWSRRRCFCRIFLRCDRLFDVSAAHDFAGCEILQRWVTSVDLSVKRG